MPLIFLYTNLPSHKLDTQFRNSLVDVLAKTLKMGINDIWLTVHAGPECCHRGIDEEEEANAAAHQAIIQLNVSEERNAFQGI
jgi:hypothetical protein